MAQSATDIVHRLFPNGKFYATRVGSPNLRLCSQCSDPLNQEDWRDSLCPCCRAQINLCCHAEGRPEPGRRRPGATGEAGPRGTAEIRTMNTTPILHRLVVAASQGRGVRLSADEAMALASDPQILRIVENDDDWCKDHERPVQQCCARYEG